MGNKQITTIVGQELTEPILSFWNECVLANFFGPDRHLYEYFQFGDSESLANELAELVLSGNKRATATLLWDYELANKPLPEVGSLSVVTNGAGHPLFVIETTSLETVPFDKITSDFAAAEGEGDGSLAYWQEAHTVYFSRRCKELNREFHGEVIVVCERFEVIFTGPTHQAQ